MILPDNGKVIIIDDQPDDVRDLMTALSKEKIPYVHYKELDGSDLPDTPIENVRLLFLDLELVTGTYMSPKDITGPIKTRLLRVIKPNNPYMLILWSKKENKYKDALLKDFEDDFAEYKPILYKSLPKADILKKHNSMELIRIELKDEFSKMSSFKAFLKWESIVNNSAGQETNNFISLYDRTDKWDQTTKYLLHKLSVAYSGKTASDLDDISQLRNAFLTLNFSLIDELENNIKRELYGPEFDKLISKIPEQVVNFNSTINSRLLLSFNSDQSMQPGNIFYIKKETTIEEEKIESDHKRRLEGIEKAEEAKQVDLRQKAEKEFAKAKAEHDGKTKERAGEYKRILNDALNLEIGNIEQIRRDIIDTAEFIELNITPLCDYAQKKTTYVRLLLGIMIKSEHKKYFLGNAAYVYITDAELRIKNESYYLLFDFRYLHSRVEKTQKDRISEYRLKHQLLSDIQIKLGSHINRSGIHFVD